MSIGTKLALPKDNMTSLTVSDSSEKRKPTAEFPLVYPLYPKGILKAKTLSQTKLIIGKLNVCFKKE